MHPEPSLEWLHFFDPKIYEVAERDGRRWWVTDNADQDTISLQLYPGGLKEGVDTASLEALRGTFRASPYTPQVFPMTFRVVETASWLSGIEETLRIPQPAGDTFIGCLLFPFLEFTFVFEVECAEHRDPSRVSAPPAASKAQADAGDDDEDSPWDDLEVDHPLSRLRELLEKIARSLRVAPELRRLRQVPLPSGETIWPRLSICCVPNDQESPEMLRDLVGVEFQELALPQLHLRAADGAFSFPSCSLSLGDGRFIVLQSEMEIAGQCDADIRCLRLMLLRRPGTITVEIDGEPLCVPAVSTISISAKGAPVKFVQLYEEQVFSRTEDEIFLRDALLLIRRTDGVQVEIRALQSLSAPPGELQCSILPGPRMDMEESYRLSWDSRWDPIPLIPPEFKQLLEGAFLEVGARLRQEDQ
jgi:hypothetical protein